MKTVEILDKFIFTQNNLQSYLDCPRQFELRFLLKQECPPASTTAQAASRHFAELGTQFHELVHRHLIGIPVEDTLNHYNDPQIQTWWQHFDSLNPLPGNIAQKCPELTISCSIERYRLLAKLDLAVVTTDQRVLIFEWKTSPNLPNPQILKSRLQSRLYPLVLSKMSRMGSLDFSPDQVSMIYWFANQPERAVIFQYSTTQMIADQKYLIQLIDEISSIPFGEFKKTRNMRKCQYCDFFLLCHKQKYNHYHDHTKIDNNFYETLESDLIIEEEIQFKPD